MTKNNHKCEDCGRTTKWAKSMVKHRIMFHLSKISREFLEGFGDAELLAHYDRNIAMRGY